MSPALYAGRGYCGELTGLTKNILRLFARRRKSLSSEDVLRSIESGKPITAQVVLVTAHPDDEVVGMGGTMAHFVDLTIVQLSDGAPLDEDRVREAGFDARTAYAQRRRQEVLHAVSVCAPQLSRFACFELTDGKLVDEVPSMVRRLEGELLAADAVVTHPYEGGHMDHDVAAFCVQTACRNLEATGCKAPVRLEFASYYNNGGMLQTGDFWSDPNCREIAIPLTPAMLWRREAAFGCHETQANNLRAFGFREECFRVAPVYDFSRPPPPDMTLYGDHISAKLIDAFRAYGDNASSTGRPWRADDVRAEA